MSFCSCLINLADSRRDFYTFNASNVSSLVSFNLQTENSGNKQSWSAGPKMIVLSHILISMFIYDLKIQSVIFEPILAAEYI